MAEEQNDISIRGQALQNVLVVDAFLRRYDIHTVIFYHHDSDNYYYRYFYYCYCDCDYYDYYYYECD